MADIWFRNAQSCMSVCVEEGVTRLTWTRQQLMRMRMDGIMYVRQFYMHTPLRPKIRIIGIQGTGEYDIFGRFDKPDAVYPTWSGKGDTFDDLKRLIDNPWGVNQSLCEDTRTPSSLRPTFGQKHIVVIHNSPSASTGVGQQFWNKVAAVQANNPHVELFVNGTSSFSVLFGLNFRSCDFGLSDHGDQNIQLYLPTGIRIKINDGQVRKLYQWEDWIRVMGFTLNQVVEDKNQARYRLRIRSLKWASKHWASNFRFHTDRNIAVDTESSDADFIAPQSRAIVLRRKLYTTKEADKILCNRCRIAPGCRVFRVDSICGLRDSEMTELANYFQSRNAGLIVDGLAELTRLQAKRLDNALTAEATSTELDPEVTKLMKQLFDSGVKLAKLVDPNLAGPGTKVQVNVGVGVNSGSAEIVSMTNPKDLMAGIVNQLEVRGIPRDKITPQMIEGVLRGMASQSSQPQAIEAQAITMEDVLGKQVGNEDAGDGQLPLPIPVSRDEA